MPDKSNPWAVTPDPALQEMISNILGDLEPLSRQCQEILEQAGCFQPLDSETQQLINYCQQICQDVSKSETWKDFQQTAALITNELQRPEYQDFAKRACEIIQHALNVQQDYLQNTSVDHQSVRKTPSEPIVTAEAVDWFEQVLPIERRPIWANIDNKNGLIQTAINMASIVLPRVIPQNASEIRDVTDVTLLFLLAVVFLNMLVSAFDKGEDDR